ncbi:MAG: leucine-rich repeat domain-containing protein [Clostridia bacterium]|nr:leucine-rich repeat domain-containing protein [Clostridia bacterium]
MKKCLLVLLALTILLALSSCNLFEEKEDVISIERIEINGNTAAVHYKSGYTYYIDNLDRQIISYRRLQDGTYEAGLIGSILHSIDHQTVQSIDFLEGVDLYHRVTKKKTGETISRYVFDIQGQAYEYYGSQIAQQIKNTLQTVEFRTDITVSRISEYAFMQCEQIQSVTIPSTVTEIGKNAFSDCYALKSVTFEGGVTEIPEQCFYRSKEMTEIVIPEGVTTVGKEAFAECTALKTVTLPASLQSLTSNAFHGTGGATYPEAEIQTVHYRGTLTQWCNIEIANQTSTPLNGAKEFHANGALISHAIIPDGTTEIKSYQFYGYKGLKRITLPDSIEMIGENAFASCDNLEYTIKDRIKYLGTESNPYLVAMGYEMAESPITSLVFQPTCRFIFGQEHVDLSSVSEITLPDALVKIGSNAFFWLGTNTVQIPDSVTYIGNNAFSNSELTSLNIPDNVTHIGSEAFSGCRSLSNITMPKSLTYLGRNAFWGCQEQLFIEQDGVRYLGNTDTPYAIAMEILSTNAFPNITIQEGCYFLSHEIVSKIPLLGSLSLPSSLKNMHAMPEWLFPSHPSQINNQLTISYNGTRAQWEAITKIPEWETYIPNYVLKCSDITITKENGKYYYSK